MRILLKSFGWVIVQKVSDGYSSSNWCHLVNLWTMLSRFCPSLFPRCNKISVTFLIPTNKTWSKSFNCAVTKNRVHWMKIVNFFLLRWSDHRAWGLSTPVCPSLDKWDSTKMSASRESPRRSWRPSPCPSSPRTSSRAGATSSPTSRPPPLSRRSPARRRPYSGSLILSTKWEIF